jgi:SpoVK/Ycf46/Vps4 family AAA+-type ATPase
MEQLKSRLKGVKKRARREPLEMNLICNGKNGLYLTGVEVKKTRLDVSMYYNDDFMETDETIRRRLNRKADKGIVLLHGIPGTGKTTYLRYLVGKIKKRVLFVPPEVAGRISNPELLQLLVDNPDSVLVIEDAENIIMQRQAGFDSSVSNLLNISDGLLSDFLNVQVICTFNSALSTVDEALLRKGRLIARYEFGKLSVGKAQRLSNHLGFHTSISRPMTIAEIANQHEAPATEPVRQLIGFRRELMTT